MNDEDAVDIRAVAATGGRFEELCGPCSTAGRALLALSLPPTAPITLAAELAAYGVVWGDAVSALAHGFEAMGSGVRDAASTYDEVEERAGRRFQDAGNRWGL